MGDAPKPGAVANFFSASVLLLVSMFVLQQSYSIYVGAGVPLTISPALMPLFLACCLLLCALIMLARTLKQHSADYLMRAIRNEIQNWFQSAESDWRRVLGGLGILGAYIFILIPIFEFWLSTSIFMVAIFLFLKATSLWKVGLITAGTVGGIVMLFHKIFGVNLP